MKILTSIIRTLLTLVLITTVLVVGTFFLTIFMPENVLQAIAIFKNIFQKP